MLKQADLGPFRFDPLSILSHIIDPLSNGLRPRGTDRTSLVVVDYGGYLRITTHLLLGWEPNQRCKCTELRCTVATQRHTLLHPGFRAPALGRGY